MTSIVQLLESTEKAFERLSEIYGPEDGTDDGALLPRTGLLELLHLTDRFVINLREKMGNWSQSSDLEAESEFNCNNNSNKTLQKIPLNGGHQLRDYQWIGVQWLLSLHGSGLNGILADEMGLGKTLQVITFLCQLRELCGVCGPHLIIAPLSVLQTWKNDVEKFFESGKVSLHVHYGTVEERSSRFNSWRTGLSRAQGKVNIFLTTYEICLRDISTIKNFGRRGGKLGWYYMAIDEGHRLKNKRGQAFSQLATINANFKILLTGTPVQNNLSELWSLLTFLMPGLFHDARLLSEWFNRPFELTDAATTDESQDAENQVTSGREDAKQTIIRTLHRAIAPFVLRRLKADAAIDIPLKIERLVECPMSELQRQTYYMIRSLVLDKMKGDPTKQTLHTRLAADSDLSQKLYSQNIIMQLKKLSNHPYLVLEDVRPIPDDKYFADLVASSGKMLMLHLLLQSLLVNDHKVLIFCQMTSTLDIIHGYCQLQDISICRIDGATRSAEREQQITLFNSSGKDSSGSSPKIFLLSTRSGGVGINLQAADTVVLFDSDWNPQMDLQAMSRAHRIGQTKQVLVLRLITQAADCCSPSIEKKILDRADFKMATERVILSKGQFQMNEVVDYVGEDIDESSSDNEEMMAQLLGNQDSLFSLFDDSRQIAADEHSLTFGSLFSKAADVYVNEASNNVDYMFSSASIDAILCRDDCTGSNVCDAVVKETSAISRQPDGCCLLSTTDHWSDWFQSDIDSALGMDDKPSENDARRLRSQVTGVTLRYISDSYSSYDEQETGANNSDGRTNEELKPKKRRRQQHLNNGEDAHSVLRPKHRLKSNRARGASPSLVRRTTTRKPSRKPALAAESFEYDNDFCVICGLGVLLGDSTDDSLQGPSDADQSNLTSTLLLCDSCEGGYHFGCVGISEVPIGDWFCRFCECLNNKL